MNNEVQKRVELTHEVLSNKVMPELLEMGYGDQVNFINDIKNRLLEHRDRCIKELLNEIENKKILIENISKGSAEIGLTANTCATINKADY